MTMKSSRLSQTSEVGNLLCMFTRQAGQGQKEELRLHLGHSRGSRRSQRRQEDTIHCKAPARPYEFGKNSCLNTSSRRTSRASKCFPRLVLLLLLRLLLYPKRHLRFDRCVGSTMSDFCRQAFIFLCSSSCCQPNTVHSTSLATFRALSS